MPEQAQILKVKIVCAQAMIQFNFAVAPLGPNHAPDLHKATKDPRKFERYLRAHPTFNYVVATGKCSRVFVITAKGVEGLMNFLNMVKANGGIPRTMIAIGSEHTYFYFLMAETGVPNCEIAEGVEVRGDENFVLGPGSQDTDGSIVGIDFDLCCRGGKGLNVHAAPAWLLKAVNAAEIKRLAQLSEIEYEHERDNAARRLKCRVSLIDKLVQRARQQGTADRNKGRLPSLREPKLWPEVVDGSVLFDDLSDAVLRYVVVAKDIARAIALWIVHTYALLAFNITPRLAIKSPVPQCGKTTLLDVLSCLVCRPLSTANVTAAALFRVVDAESPTLLIDEADTFLVKNDELRAILNSGHRRSSAHVHRVEGENLEPREFGTFAAAAIACIGPLPETVEDRSIFGNLKRRRPDETIEQLDLNNVSHLTDLASKTARWASDHLSELKESDPLVPSTLRNREADNWRPLFGIADAAGGEWPSQVRRIAEEMTKSARTHEVSVKVLLLRDIRSAFVDNNVDRISSDRLVKSLIGMEGQPWCEWRGNQPLTQNALAYLLRDFEIHPIRVRIGEKVLRGYKIDQFADAFGRYLADGC